MGRGFGKFGFLSCIINSKEIWATTKKRSQKSAQKKTKTKRHYTICGSENHNCGQYDQEPNANSHSEFLRKNDNHKSFLLLDKESTWNGFSDGNKKQSSVEQDIKYK